ncbi:MAG: redoxin domain-containing protein [Pseudomonadota bacterium]
MFKLDRRALLAGAAALMLAPVYAAANLEPNAAAPSFAAVDTAGATVDLAALKGRTVVLEWTNHQCPFVAKHYRSGNMQALQKDAAAADVTWISIISSAPGRQGFVEALEADAIAEEQGAIRAHTVLDPTGEIGKLYGARVTPQMVVIDPAGEIAYMGGIDDIPTADMADIPRATNYVRAALDALAAGRTPEVQSARPYGCSIKYAS